MKEATASLSSGLIVVICVAIFIAFFYYTIWPTIDNNFKGQTACDKAKCSVTPYPNGMVKCEYEDQSFYCKYKG